MFTVFASFCSNNTFNISRYKTVLMANQLARLTNDFDVSDPVYMGSYYVFNLVAEYKYLGV